MMMQYQNSFHPLYNEMDSDYYKKNGALHVPFYSPIRDICDLSINLSQ